MQNTTTRRTRDDYRLMARARRLETERVTEEAAFKAAGRCTCGLPVTAPGASTCATCTTEHRAAVKRAFEGL